MMALATTAFAQQEPQELIDQFFTSYEADAGKAVRELYKTNPWTERAKDDVDNIVNIVNGFNEESLGAYFGNELIITKKYSESFILYSYMVKYDRQPLRFLFKFYKPNDKWMLYSFSLDDEIDAEIEEAAKLYNLNLIK